MYTSTAQRRRIRLSAIALTVCFVFEMGACPCGCLEHNYWLALFGHSSDSSTPAQGDHDTGLLVASDHDCTGKSRDEFVNTARLPETGSRQLQISHFTIDSPDAHGTLSAAEPFFNRGPAGRLPIAPDLVSLQVFRL